MLFLGLGGGVGVVQAIAAAGLPLAVPEVVSCLLGAVRAVVDLLVPTGAGLSYLEKIMYDKERTTFARYPYVPTRTAPHQLLSIYLAHCEEDPRFHTSDLERHVLAIDVRRFDPEAIEDALEGVTLSTSFWELEMELQELLLELIDMYGDPTRWPPLLHHLPPLLTIEDTSPHHGWDR